jgi:SseB protein N-terminal domain
MRSLPDPGFAGDDGAADPALADALAGYASDRAPAPVLAALCRARLLLPVVAMLGESDVGDAGLVRDKSADVAAVLMRARDGRRALLAFSSLATLQAWDPKARPVPVSAPDAARAARSEGAEALLVDAGGPVSFVVETEDLEDIAAGHLLTRTSLGYAWLAPG